MKEHHHRNGHAHFTTLSTYHRMRLLDSERFKRWVETLDELRGEVGFRLLGYGSDAGAFPFVDLPGRAGRIFKDQRQSEAEDCPIHQEPENMLELPVVPRNQGMMQGIALPDSLHDESTYRVWQRRCYDFDVWSAKKRLEKLESMHGNPVKRKKDGKESWRLAMVQLEVLSLER